MGRGSSRSNGSAGGAGRSSNSRGASDLLYGTPPSQTRIPTLAGEKPRDVELLERLMPEIVRGDFTGLLRELRRIGPEAVQDPPPLAQEAYDQAAAAVVLHTYRYLSPGKAQVKHDRGAGSEYGVFFSRVRDELPEAIFYADRDRDLGIEAFEGMCASAIYLHDGAAGPLARARSGELGKTNLDPDKLDQTYRWLEFDVWAASPGYEGAHEPEGILLDAVVAASGNFATDAFERCLGGEIDHQLLNKVLDEIPDRVAQCPAGADPVEDLRSHLGQIIAYRMATHPGLPIPGCKPDVDLHEESREALYYSAITEGIDSRSFRRRLGEITTPEERLAG